jgi:CcmD family protein
MDTFLLAYAIAWTGLALYVLRLRSAQAQLARRLDAIATAGAEGGRDAHPGG